MRRAYMTLTATLLLSTALTGLAQAQTAPEITGIELGQAGIARYTMTAEATGSLITFTVPEAASSDVLASLVVRDPAGGVVDIQTDTPGAAAAALRDTIFASGVPTDTIGLLQALQGESVTLTTEKGSVTGQVMGLRRFDAVEDGQRVDRMAAILLNGTGVAEVVLSPGTRVGFSEDAARHLGRIMKTQLSKLDTRQFDLTLEADTAREVELSYVTEAAAWKNSWRLLLDEGRLQGWAVFENVSGADWQDIELTLTTGAPVAYRRDLIDPRFIARAENGETRPEPITVEADSGGGLMSMYSGRALSTKASPTPPSGSASEALPSQSGGILRYTLPEEVDLKNGRTANLMYLDMAIEPQIRGLYRPETREAQVLLAARIETDQALASGLVSVQDSSGFVGDAPFLGMLAGDTRLLPFAVATGSETRTESDERLSLTTIKHQDGQLALSFEQRRTTTYAATLPPQVDIFTVEHPRGFGDLASTTGEAEHLDAHYRLSVPVTEGRAEVTLVETREASRSMRIGTGEFATLIADIASGRIEVSEAHRAAFDQAHTLKSEVEAADRARSAAERRYGALSEEQKRLRENLDAVTQDSLRARYLDALAKTEAEIAEIFDAMGRYEDEMAGMEQRLLEIFAAF